MNAPMLRRTYVTALVAGVIATVAVAVLRDAAAAATVALGAVVSIANLAILQRSLGRIVAATARDEAPPATAALALVGKFGALAALLFFLVVHVGLGGLELAIGLSAIPLAIVAQALVAGGSGDAEPSTQGS